MLFNFRPATRHNLKCTMWTHRSVPSCLLTVFNQVEAPASCYGCYGQACPMCWVLGIHPCPIQGMFGMRFALFDGQALGLAASLQGHNVFQHAVTPFSWQQCVRPCQLATRHDTDLLLFLERVVSVRRKKPVSVRLLKQITAPQVCLLNAPPSTLTSC